MHLYCTEGGGNMQGGAMPSCRFHFGIKIHVFSGVATVYGARGEFSRIPPHKMQMVAHPYKYKKMKNLLFYIRALLFYNPFGAPQTLAW